MKVEKAQPLILLEFVCPTTAEVKGWCSGPVGLLRIIDPYDRPLDPAYPWAHGTFPWSRTQRL